MIHKILVMYIRRKTMKTKERKVILAICVYAICVILTFLIVPKRMVCDICGRTFTVSAQ